MKLNPPVMELLIYERRLNHSEVARRVGKHPSVISRACRGKTALSAGTIQSIAKVLGVPAEAITLPEVQKAAS